jgi:glycosyltransferase involved in cell wall biosynthesis
LDEKRVQIAAVIKGKNLSQEFVMPRVSVIVPTYNQDKYLGFCIDSILNQTYRDFELIVVDDGSTDTTQEIVAKYNANVRYIHKQNGGTPSALNAGIRVANGEYLAWLSSDDLYLPNKLEKQIAQLSECSEIKVLHTAFYLVDTNGNVIRKVVFSQDVFSDFSPVKLMKHNTINGSSILFHRECIERVGLFDESIHGTEDWDMWIRMACYYKFGYLSEPLISYRWHDSNFSHKRPRINEAAWKMLEKAMDNRALLDNLDNNGDRRHPTDNVARLCVEIADAYWEHPVHNDLISRLWWKSIRVKPVQGHAYKYLVSWFLDGRIRRSINDKCLAKAAQYEELSRLSSFLLRVLAFLIRPGLPKRLGRRLITFFQNGVG